MAQTPVDPDDALYAKYAAKSAENNPPPQTAAPVDPDDALYAKYAAKSATPVDQGLPGGVQSPKWGHDEPEKQSLWDKAKNTFGGLKDVAVETAKQAWPESLGGKGHDFNADEFETGIDAAVGTIPTAITKGVGYLGHKINSSYPEYKGDNVVDDLSGYAAATVKGWRGGTDEDQQKAYEAELAKGEKHRADNPYANTLGSMYGLGPASDLGAGLAGASAEAAGAAPILTKTAKFAGGNIAASSAGQGAQGHLDPDQVLLDTGVSAATEGGLHGIAPVLKSLSRTAKDTASGGVGMAARAGRDPQGETAKYSQEISDGGINAPATQVANYGVKEARRLQGRAAEIGPTFDEVGKNEIRNIAQPVHEHLDAQENQLSTDSQRLTDEKAVIAKAKEEAEYRNKTTQQDLTDKSKEQRDQIAQHAEDAKQLAADVKRGVAGDASDSINEFLDENQKHVDNVIGPQRDAIYDKIRGQDLSNKEKLSAARLENTLRKKFIDSGGEQTASLKALLDDHLPSTETDRGTYYKRLINLRTLMGSRAKFNVLDPVTGMGAARSGYDLISDLIRDHNEELKATDNPFREAFVAKDAAKQAGLQKSFQIDANGSGKWVREATPESLLETARNPTLADQNVENFRNFNNNAGNGVRAPVEDLQRAYDVGQARTPDEIIAAHGNPLDLTTTQQHRLGLLQDARTKLLDAQTQLEATKAQARQSGNDFDKEVMGHNNKLRKNASDVRANKAQAKTSQQTRATLNNGFQEPNAVIDARKELGTTVTPEHEAAAETIANVHSGRNHLADLPGGAGIDPQKASRLDPLQESLMITKNVRGEGTENVPQSMKNRVLTPEDEKDAQFLQDRRPTLNRLEKIAKEGSNEPFDTHAMNTANLATSHAVTRIAHAVGLPSLLTGVRSALRVVSDAASSPRALIEAQANLKTWAGDGSFGKDLKNAFGLSDKSAVVLAREVATTGKPVPASFAQRVIGMFEGPEKAQSVLQNLIASGIAVHAQNPDKSKEPRKNGRNRAPKP